MARGRTAIVVLVFGVLFGVLAAAGAPGAEPRLVENLARANGSSFRLAQVRDAVPFGSRLLFFGRDEEHGEEIWSTDGTAAGTRLVVDLCPGPASAFPFPIDLEGPSGSPARFFVSPNCDIPSTFLWATDGTAAGTRPVLDLEGHATDSPYFIVGDAGSTGRRLVAKGPSFGANAVDELYFVDGTTGTVVRWAAAPATFRARRATAATGTPFRDRVFFPASDAARGLEPWVSDGTAAGTASLDLNPGAGSSEWLGPWESGGSAWFLVRAPAERRGLWKSDGTAAGTARVAEIDVTTEALQFSAGSGRTFFEPREGELWVSDGTPAGTVAVLTKTGSFLHLPPRQLPGDRLFFFLEDPAIGAAPWVSDGTVAGTRVLAPSCPGGCEIEYSFDPLIVTDRGAYFRALDETRGRELWVSDGTNAGTRPFDLCTGVCSGEGFPLTEAAGALWFTAVQTPGARPQLWRTDGTDLGTLAVAALPIDHGLEVAGSAGDRLVVFVADDIALEELWVVPRDAFPAAQRIADLDPRDHESGSAPRDFWRDGDRVLFLAHDDQGDQVWTSGGTAETTSSLWSLPGAGPLPPALGRLALVGPWALATETDGNNLGRQILRVSTADGSSRRLTGAVFPDEVLEVQGFTVVGSRALYFQRDSGLAAADPATGRIEVLSPVVPAPAAPVKVPAIHGGAWFFTTFVAGGGLGSELWMTDGTPAGTVRPYVGEPIGLVAATPSAVFVNSGFEGLNLLATQRLPNGTLAPRVPLFADPSRFAERAVTTRTRAFFFTRLISGFVYDLVVSDGTPAGTRRLAVGPWRRVGDAAAFGETVYFAAEDATTGLELWRSDGTEAGTVRVADLWPGVTGSSPAGLEVLDGRLFFSASDGEHGNELWTSDGTAAGTVRLTDLAPGVRSSNPSNLTIVGGDLIFTANDGAIGREPWLYPLGELSGRPAIPADVGWLGSPALPGYRFKVRIGGAGEDPIAGAVEPACIPETVCVSGALPGRPEVFLRIVGPRANGYLWPTVVKFSTSAIEVWLEDAATGALRYYDLAGARPGFDELPGLFDRRGFLPRLGGESAVAGLAAPVVAGDDDPPPPGTWFTSPQLPGFRVGVAIAGGSAPVRAEAACIAETLCVSGAVPGRSEVFVRVVGPKPNGFLWPTLVKFTTSELEVWIEQLASGARQYYRIPGAAPDRDDLTGLFDREGFLP